MTHPAELVELKQRLREISDLRGAESVLGWDQATYMPPGGAEARGRQLALLSRLGHERLVEPAIGRLLDSLAPWAEAQGADSDAAALSTILLVASGVAVYAVYWVSGRNESAFV